MGWLTGIEGIQPIPPGSGLHQAVVPSPEEAGRSLIPSAGFTFPVDGDGQDLVVAENFPPTLPSLAALNCHTLVSNLEKGDDTR